MWKEDLNDHVMEVSQVIKLRIEIKCRESRSSFVKISARLVLPSQCEIVTNCANTLSRMAFSLICMWRIRLEVVLLLQETHAVLSLKTGIALGSKVLDQPRSVIMFLSSRRTLTHSSVA